MIDLKKFRAENLRQYRHNQGEGYVFSYDKEAVEFLIDRAISAESIVSAHKDAIQARDEVISLLKSESDELKAKLAQRITEQDVREILNSFRVECELTGLDEFAEWFASFSCHDLLAKLNEHREQVTPNKAEVKDWSLQIIKLNHVLKMNADVMTGTGVEYIKQVIEDLKPLPPLKDE